MKKQNTYILDDYVFATKTEYERAQKEKETIDYINANTNMTDMKAVLKVYNRSIEKKSFQTVIGLEFVKNMRKRLVASEVVGEDTIAKVPVPKKAMAGGSSRPVDKDMAAAEVKKYKEAYESAVAGRKIRNMVIGFLIVIIAAIMFITYKTKYSVYTYFTNYQQNMENELIDKYEKWENDLDARQKALDDGNDNSSDVSSSDS